MIPTNRVFIATSLDGYIADKNGGIDFLETIPEMNTVDSGYNDLMDKTDALLMGRKTFEKVLSFGIDWPYEKPVFVLSSSLKKAPDGYEGKVFPVSGKLSEVLESIHNEGYKQLYIDGGQTIQSFLKEELIDEMIITIITVLLGGGVRLFGDLETPQIFECVKTELFADKVVQNHYVKQKKDQ